MKTFNLYVNEDIENPYFHYRDGSSLLGPGMGQYDPIADLNAQRQVLGKLQVKGNFKEITKSDLDQIEKYADRLFGALDIDVEFTRHFLDRVNDMRNKVAITPAELTRLFKQTYKKHGKTIARLGPDAEAVITDMKTDINMPFVLNLKGGELELVAKTVMRKKNFKTTNPKLAFEDVSEARAKKAVAGGKVQKLVTAHGLTYKGKKYKEIDMELVKIDNSSEVVTFNIIHPKEIFGDEVKIPFRTLRRGPFMATDTSKINEDFEFFPKKLHERITLPEPPKDLDRELDILKKLMARRTSEDEESIRNHDENSFYAIEKYCEKHGLIFHDREMKDIVLDAKDTIGYFKELFNLPRPFEVDKTIKPMGSTTNKTRSYPSGHACQSRLVGLYVANKFPEHEKGVMEAAKECGIGRVLAGFHYLADYVAGNLLADKMFLVMNKDDYGKYLDEAPRIPRKKGQHRGSSSHSDLYTDENPRGTIHGLGFKDVETARASVKKIENSGKKHAHKIQAAVAMEQRAKEMGKTAEAAIYRAYIEKMKKKTKEMQKEGTYFTRTRSNKSRGQIMKKQLRPKIEPLMRDIGFKRGSYKMEPNASANNLIITVDKSDLDKVKKALEPLGLPNIVQVVSEDTHGFKCPSGYKFDKKLMACVPIKSRFKTHYAYPYFFGGNKSGDQSGETQHGNGNGNGNGNGANGNGGNGNGNSGGESFLAADVRKMPDGRYGVYADRFVKGKRVMTPGGKHAKELKKVYKNEKDANDYMAAIMMAKSGR